MIMRGGGGGIIIHSPLRWSTLQPVPSLGDMDTPIEEVNAFYDFWYGWGGWRCWGGGDIVNLLLCTGMASIPGATSLIQMSIIWTKLSREFTKPSH